MLCFLWGELGKCPSCTAMCIYRLDIRCLSLLHFKRLIKSVDGGRKNSEVILKDAAPLLQIEDYDVVASMLAARSSLLCSVDLWRCRNLTDRGLVELVSGCRWGLGCFVPFDGAFKSFICEEPKQNTCELVCSHQDAGGAGPGLVSHAPEQHRVFPDTRSQPASPAQTLPHCQPHCLRLGHRGAGYLLSLTTAP